MVKENHPWLRWPGADKDPKILLNNRLASLQKKQICPPREIDWEMLNNLGIRKEVDDMLCSKVSDLDEDREFPVWKRIFHLNEPVVREWCLEFFSSLSVDEDFTDVLRRKTVHFRIGGKERHCSLLQFGYLTGMYTREEMEDEEELLCEFVTRCVRETTGFDDDNSRYWTEISGKEHHIPSESRAALIRLPILRVLHKMITYAFHHRSTHNDKVYVDDLWLLRIFHQGGDYRTVDPAWALARWMTSHGDSMICCGHFVTKIVKTLNLESNESIRQCSIPFDMLIMSYTDLMKSKLLDATGKRLIAEGEEPPLRHVRSLVARPTQRKRQATEAPPELDMGELSRQLGQISEAQTRLGDQQMVMSTQMGRLMYEQEYYHPFMQRWAAREAQEMGESLPTFAPPSLFMPTQTYGGFYYPPRQPQGDPGAGGSGSQHPQAPPQFGQYQGGSPSIFPDPGDMQD